MTDDPAYFEKGLAEGFINRLNTPLWVYDFDERRVAWANQAALGLWNADTLEALRRRDLGADMSFSVERRLNQYREDFIAHDTTFSELWTLYPNGQPVTKRVVYRGIRLQDERMAMLCEALETEVGAPETLRSADALLHTSVMISLFRRSGEPLYRNPAARIAYGGAAVTFGEQFAESADFAALEEDLAGGRVVKRTAEMKTVGNTRWHEVTAFCCKDAVTGEDSVLVSEVDVSDMKAAKQRLGEFASVSSDWFWEMDSELRFSYFSARAKELSGANINALLGKRRSDVMLALDGNWSDHLDDLEHRRPFRDFRYAIRGDDGKIYHLSASGVPIFDHHGRFAGYRGTGTNITERVEAEKRIAEQRELEAALAKEREINGLQRQFVSMVSHEFRTPLAVIDGSAQRVTRRFEKLEPAQITESMQKIRRSVVRLTELMESVLNAARLEEGRIPFEPEACDLAGIIKELLESYREVCPSHIIDLDIDDLPDQITADPKLIRQVVSNLTSNAVKYSPAGTTIWIKAFRDIANKAVKVSVRDEGLGIPESELSQLCNRFFRASTSTGITGTGIGLHLCQHFVSLHGGRIEIESTEGQGSTFTICLPATVSEPSGEWAVEDIDA